MAYKSVFLISRDGKKNRPGTVKEMVKMKNSLNLWVLQKIFPNICKAKKKFTNSTEKVHFPKTKVQEFKDNSPTISI